MHEDGACAAAAQGAAARVAAGLLTERTSKYVPLSMCSEQHLRNHSKPRAKKSGRHRAPYRRSSAATSQPVDFDGQVHHHKRSRVVQNAIRKFARLQGVLLLPLHGGERRSKAGICERFLSALFELQYEHSGVRALVMR